MHFTVIAQVACQQLGGAKFAMAVIGDWIGVCRMFQACGWRVAAARLWRRHASCEAPSLMMPAAARIGPIHLGSPLLPNKAYIKSRSFFS